VLKALLLLLGAGGILLPVAPVGAAAPAVRIDLNQAIQAVNQSFDPRSDTQWGARNKPMPGGEQPWMARHAFNAERIRSILTEVYYRGPQRLGNSGAALLVIEAGRSKGVAEIDLIVSKDAFLELLPLLLFFWIIYEGESLNHASRIPQKTCADSRKI
jgi:hypothetical protein